MPGLLHQFGHPVKLLRTHHQIQPRDFFFEGLPPPLGHAAQEPKHYAGILFSKSPQIAHLPQSFLLGKIPNTTRVEEDDIRLLFGNGSLVALIMELAEHLLRIPLIHLAPVSF